MEHYYYKNVHGDVIFAYTSNHWRSSEYGYIAYGEESTSYDYYSANPNPIRYSGEYLDTESGMSYLRARYYDPHQRRFISEDPAEDGLNWYAYCGNNPVNRVDPTGLDSWVFYDGEAFGEQAKTEAKNLKKQYGTEVHLVDIWSLTGFLDNWNKMVETDGTIDGVSMLFHGSPFTIYLGEADGQVGQLTSSTQNVTPGGSSGYYVGDLAKASMKSLNVMSCNGGHLDYVYSDEYYQEKGFSHNIAVEFLVTHNIDIVYGMDGSLAYTEIFGAYMPRLAWDQDAYYSWTPKRRFLWKRAANGKVKFWLNEEGSVELCPMW